MAKGEKTRVLVTGGCQTPMAWCNSIPAACTDRVNRPAASPRSRAFACHRW
jgi:hypothetical protein